MKPLLALIAACLLTLGMSCGSHAADDELYVFTSFREPANGGLRFLYSDDGLHWDSIPGAWLTPRLGQGILRDPSIVRGDDGTFHLVWTIAWRGDTGLGYSSSQDLMHWTEPRRIPAMDSVASTQNVWAPELFYDDERGQYIIVYASCVVDAGFDVGVEDTTNNHRLYCITTRDFESFSPPRLMYDPGFSCIDATIVKRGKGDYAMVFKDNTRPERTLRVAFASHADGPWGQPSAPFTDKMVEGPTVVSIGDDYLIYYDAYAKRTYGAMLTRDFATFTDIGQRISVPQGHKHGTIFRAPRSMVMRMADPKSQHPAP